jgi:hypothetical protein
MRPLQSSDLNNVTIPAMNPPMSGVSGAPSLSRLATIAPCGSGSCLPTVLGGGTVLWYTGKSQTFTAIWGCTSTWGLAAVASQTLHCNGVT